MASYDENLCQAMEIIAENAVKKAGYDKTIQATIVSCEDKTIGCYKVQYQDSIFYAYAADAKVSYTKGSLVYILVPNSNFSNNKTILGSVKKLGSDYVQVTEEKDQYELIGGNLAEAISSFILSSYYDEQKILYDVEQGINLVNFNTTAATEYLKQSTHLALGLTVQTKLTENQRFLGSYGLIVQVLDTNGNLKNYQFDNSSMSGNTYKYFSPSSQMGFYSIDGTRVKEITKILIFANNFPEKKKIEELTATDYDIALNDIKIYGAKLIEKDENGYSISIKCEQGLYFDSSKTADKKIVAEPHINGSIVNENLQTVKYYWFIKDDSINLDSFGYCLYGGKGWRCLNDYEVLEYQAGINTYTLAADVAKSVNNIFKVVAVFEANIVSREFTITNYMSGYYVNLVSDRGTNFYLDQGEPILTIKCSVEDSGLTYYWTKTEKDGTITNIENNSKDLQVYIRDINEYTIYGCTVYLNETFVGSDFLKITNGTQPEGSYTLTLQGVTTYKYDENGIAPTAASQQKPQAIEPLTFALRNNITGENIDTNKLIQITDVIWRVPIENTLLKFAAAGWKEEDGYRYYKGLDSLNYTIETRYDYSKTNNTVELEVYYDGFNLKTSVDFWMRKEGENGTNGTAVSCRIVPDVTEGGKTPDWPIIYWKDGYIYPNFISKAGYYSPQFKTEVYEEGELVSAEEYSVEWSFLQNNYGGGVHESHWYEVSNEGRLTRVSDKEIEVAAAQMNYPCNILQAKIKYSNNVYYTTLPIVSAILTDDITIEIKDNTGFKEVQYTSDGTNPKYNNAEPFTFVIKDSLENDISFNDSIKYSYGLFGSRYVNKAWEADSYLSNSFKGLKKNQIKVKPSNIYSGELLNSGFTAMITKDENNSAVILYIPIHFYLNRFGLSNLNDWNGNSIQINEDGGYILSPQLGAGTKDTNNRFTGLLMGEAKEANATSSKIGLIGFSEGEQSFFLDAETGAATFGKSGAGQIQIDPGSDSAILKSGNYSSQDQTGMKIDLSEPSITFGSGNFSVNKDGILSAQGVLIDGQGKFEGEVKANSGSFKGTIEATSGTFGKGSQKIKIGEDSDLYNSNIHSGEHNSLASTEKGFYLAHDGFSIGGNFKLTSDGELSASNVNITGEINATKGVFSGDISITGSLKGSNWKMTKDGLNFFDKNNQVIAQIETNTDESTGTVGMNFAGPIYVSATPAGTGYKGLTTNIKNYTGWWVGGWGPILWTSGTQYSFVNGILIDRENPTWNKEQSEEDDGFIPDTGQNRDNYD